MDLGGKPTVLEHGGESFSFFSLVLNKQKRFIPLAPNEKIKNEVRFISLGGGGEN